MAENLPALGADVILEFQQSIQNIQMFGQAMEGLDSKFGGIERRVDSLRSSLSSLSTQVSRGAGKDLRAEMQRELDNLVASNGVVLNRVGTMPLKVSQETVRKLFTQAEHLINQKLASSFANLTVEINPSLNNGKVQIGNDEFKEVNKAIARLVRTQLDNLVQAIRKQGASLVTAEDLASLKMHIGKGTAQQIIEKVKQELVKVMLNPQVNVGDLKLTFSQKDLTRLMSKINSQIKSSLDESVKQVDQAKHTDNLAPQLRQVYNKIEKSVQAYINNLNKGMSALDSGTVTTPFQNLSKQLRRHIAKEMGEDVRKVTQALNGMKLTEAEVSGAEIRRQFSRLEQTMNKKLQGGLKTQIDELLAQVTNVKLEPDAKLKHHMINQVNRLNNAVVKKIREQVDVQFNSLLAEINSINADPKKLNRNGRIRRSSDLLYDDDYSSPRRQTDTLNQRQAPLLNDPYARRDNYFNGMGLEGAITNTLRHIVAGSMVGAPMMLLYNSIEQFKTTQLEQVKMYSNLFAQSLSNSEERAADGDNRNAGEVANETIKSLVPYTKEAAMTYAIDYGKMSEVTSIGSRLLDTPGEIKEFSNVVGQIYSIDREGDPVSDVAPGLEAFMGQFDLAVGEMEDRVVKPLAVATNVTNATTKEILQALQRSGSTFKTAGVDPEDAIAMVATSIKYTGLSGENIGNFYKSVLPRLQAPMTLKELETIGVSAYADEEQTIAKPANDILQEVADKYPMLTDPKARDVVMRAFGTYQSSKGMTTLDEFEEYRSIRETMEKFTDEQFNQMMSNNTTAPIIEMQRTGVAAQLAITSILEELSPSIVAVAQGLTNLSEGIREHKEALANMVNFLGMALVGLAARYGMQRLWTAADGPGSVARMEARDKLIGNQSRVAAWQRTGMLSNLQGVPGVNPAILANNKDNRQFYNAALKNPVLEGNLKRLADMTDDQVKNMKSYIQDNNLLVKDMKDLLHVAEESRSYTQKKPLTAAEVQNQSAFMASKLHTKNMTGIDAAFASDLSAQLRDKTQFDRINGTEKGKKALDFMGRLDEKGLSDFQKHLDDLHRTTGKSVTDFDSLTSAIDDYQNKQTQARETMRSTAPEMRRISSAVDDINSSMNRAQAGMNRFSTWLGGLSTKARGGASALGGLAKSVASLAGQMLIMAGIGEIISDLTYQSNTPKVDKELNQANKDLSDQDRVKDVFATATEGGWLEKRWNSFWGGVGRDMTGAWDGVTSPFTDKYFDSKDLSDQLYNLFGYAHETYGTKTREVDAFQSFNTGEVYRKFVEELEEKGKTLDEVIQEYNASQGDNSIITIQQEAQAAAYKANREKMEQNEEDLRVIQESMDQARDKRLANQVLGGMYQTLDLDSVMQTLSDQENKINEQTEWKTLQAKIEGKRPEDPEYIEMRTEQNEQVQKLYQDQLDGIEKYISNLKSQIKDARMNQEDPKIIEQLEASLAQWEQNYKEAAPKLKSKIKQLMDNILEETAGALMNAANWEANMKIMDYSNRDIKAGVNMDRESMDYNTQLYNNAQKRVEAYEEQLEALDQIDGTPEQMDEIAQQMEQIRGQIDQEKLNMKELQLQSVSLYRQDLQDKLTQMGNDYMGAQVAAGTSGDNTPELNKLKIKQYEDQIKLFDDQISETQQRYDLSEDEEERKALKRELMDLERQRFQAQLGIIDAKLAQITMYRQDMQDALSTMDTNYSVAQATANVVGDSSDPELRELKKTMLRDQVAEYDKQIAAQEAMLPGATEEETKQIQRELNDLKKARAQALIGLQEMRLGDISLYKDDMNDQLDEMDVEYLKKKVDTGITDESNPILRNFRIGQYNEQVELFSEEIAKLQARLPEAKTDEETKAIQQEIRDLSKQQYQAQLGILDEMKNTGGTFNLPDGVKAMTYYEYMTRNNTQSAYTVQQGDTNVTISLPNVTDGTSADKLKQIGKSIGEGISQGRNLRPQMLQNPYGYRTPV